MHDTTGRTPEHTHHQIDLLEDVDPSIRLRCAVEVGRRGTTGAAPALVERLGVEREFFVREALTWAILRMADHAVPFLHQALSSPRWLARAQAAHVLGKLGRHEDAHHLLPLIGDELDVVAAHGYAAAARTRNPSVVPALVGQLARGDAEHRNSLATALAEFGPAAVPPLVEALREDPRADVRLHAADVLGLLGSPRADRAAVALAEALDDPQEPVRLAALNALGQLRLPFAELAVGRVTRSEEPSLRHLALRLDRTRRPQAVPRHDLRRTDGHPASPTAVALTRLRRRTGAGILRCRAALAQAQGDVEAASALLLATAGTSSTAREASRPSPDDGVPGTSRASGGPACGEDRAPCDGVVAAAPGVLVELTCETDFVVRLPTFRALAQRIADLAAACEETDADALLAVPWDEGTLAETIARLSSATAERVGLGRVSRLPGRTVASLHASAPGLPPRIGALVAFDGGPGVEEIARRVALQVMASAPRYLTRGDIPVDVLTAVRVEAEEAAHAQGKPPELVPRIVAGRVERYVHDTTLLEQVSVADPGCTITGLLFGTGVHITGFTRLAVGGGRH